MTTAIRALGVVVLLLAVPATLYAQDVVEVANGDRIAGNIDRLERGRLSFRTASAGTGHQRSAGTISIIWTEVARLTSKEALDVELVSGERFTGTISSPATGKFVVTASSGPSRVLDRKEIAAIVLVEHGFRARTTGSVDFGLSWTSAQNTRTYTLSADADHRSRANAYQTDIAVNSWLSAQDNADRQTRNDLASNLRRRLANRWFAVGKFEGQQSDELQLDARVLAGGGVGRRLVQSSRTHLLVEGGFDYDGERYTGVGSFDHSAEGFAGVDWDWFEAGSATDAKVKAYTFITLDRKRARVELDSSLRRDMFWSMYWAVNVYESFDSDPPGDRPRSNFGISFSLGWTF